MIRERIEGLRDIMRRLGWDACVVSGTDPHNSEYTPAHWKQREFISGFTGSAGTVVITLDDAGLWTDSRYFIQASKQLDGSGIGLYKMGLPSTPSWYEWVANNVRQGGVVGVDSLCFTVADYKSLKKSCDAKGIGVVCRPDYLDDIWTERPTLPEMEIMVHENQYAGKSVTEKLHELRNKMKECGCGYLLMNDLSEISWLFNIRAYHIDYTPVVICFAVIGIDCAWLYIDKALVPDEIEQLLNSYGVEVQPYNSISAQIGELSVTEKIWLDTCTLNTELWVAVSNRFDLNAIIDKASPVSLMKSIKNDVEIDGFRKAYLADGVALTRFFHWLEDALKEGKVITECDAADMLSYLRAQHPDYMMDSFETISAYRENAAMPHYTASRDGEDQYIKPSGLYLNDSGAHYKYGTTDITRTMAMGECTQEECIDYTLVMKSMIALAKLKFPEGTPGCRIDAVARQPLWLECKNFGHGTGHGVGNVLSVHEGPQTIRQNMNEQPMLPGMITSDEPGLYIEGSHGIRHENMILCHKVGENEFGNWLGFETLTLVYLDTAPILKELLDREEVEWLNTYNQRVAERLCPLLSEQDAEWLKSKTKAI